MQECWRALPYEKDKAQGLFNLDWFMAFKLRVASSSDWPPDKNMTPGTEDGRVLARVMMVLSAISCGVDLLVQVVPGVIIFGLRSIPSKKTLLSWRALTTAA